MNLLEALNSITQKDLDDVVGKIGTLEAELDQLKELRKVIEIRLGIRKPLGAHLRGKIVRESRKTKRRKLRRAIRENQVRFGLRPVVASTRRRSAIGSRPGSS